MTPKVPYHQLILDYDVERDSSVFYFIPELITKELDEVVSFISENSLIFYPGYITISAAKILLLKHRINTLKGSYYE